MKSILSISIVIIMSFSTNAQDWHYDFEEAKTEASKNNKQILLVFSGSDWCAPCIKLDRQIWQSTEFQNHAKSNLVLLKADFPRRKSNQLPKVQQEKNIALAEKYNNKGYFPFVILLSAEGKVINQLGYKNLPPTDYIKAIYEQ